MHRPCPVSCPFLLLLQTCLQCQSEALGWAQNMGQGSNWGWAWSGEEPSASRCALCSYSVSSRAHSPRVLRPHPAPPASSQPLPNAVAPQSSACTQPRSASGPLPERILCPEVESSLSCLCASHAKASLTSCPCALPCWSFLPLRPHTAALHVTISHISASSANSGPLRDGSQSPPLCPQQAS